MTVQRKGFDSERFWLAVLVVSAAAIRIFLLLRYENLAGNESGNVVGALSIIENPSFQGNLDGGTSMLYRYALASFMYFWRDPQLAPRVFTVLFGIFLVIPYYGTLKVLFGRAVAFFSSLVLVFYPMHVVQSSVTSSDAVYYFFLFGSFYYFFSYKNGRERFSVLLLSALLFNIASLLRFESWIFIPIFFLLLWPRGKKTALIFFALLLVFPCAYLALCRCYGLPLFYSFTAVSRSAHDQIMAGRAPYDPRLWSWLAILWRSSGASLVVGGVAGIAWAFLTRQKRQLAVFFLVLLSALTVNTLLVRLCSLDRYSIILGLFLIPYAGFLAEQALVFLKIKRKEFLALFLIFPAMNFWQITHQPSPLMSNLFSVTLPEIKALGLWLRKNVPSDEAIIIGADRYGVWPDSIIFQSGVSPRRCLTAYTPVFGRGDFESKDEFECYALKHRIRYLVLNSEGYLQKVLNFNLDRKRQFLNKCWLDVVFEQEVPAYGKYIIYRVSHPKSLGGE